LPCLLIADLSVNPTAPNAVSPMIVANAPAIFASIPAIEESNNGAGVPVRKNLFSSYLLSSGIREAFYAFLF